MAAKLIDLFIIHQNGAVLYSNKGDEKGLDSQLFGSFLAAIQTYATSMQNEASPSASARGLQSFCVRGMQYTILQYGTLFYVGSHAKSTSTKKALKTLQYIAERFVSEFGAARLERWNGDVSIFHGFSYNAGKQGEAPAAISLENAFW